MSDLKVKTYKGFEIHYVNGTWKYDIYNHGLWYASVDSLKQAKEFIATVIWTKENIPL